MKNNPYSLKKSFKKLKAIEVKDKKISQLLTEMAGTGFQGRKLGEVVDVWEKMIKDRDVTIVMGYAGSLSTTGQWKIINWLIENHFIDVLVPTGANISEDIVEAMGSSYYQGSHVVDDREILKTDFNRYYDVYGSELDYRKMEGLICEFMQTLRADYSYSSREFLYLFGKWLSERNIQSIAAVAAKHKVPVFCPALVDSAYGEAIMIQKGKNRDFNIIIDQAKDFQEFMSLGKYAKEVAVIYIGGGVPKDFIQLLAVSSPLDNPDRQIHSRKGIKDHLGEYTYPHKYAIQITTDSPQWGALSGCTFEEAISWGKISSEGSFVQCYCDATIALPIVTHALAEKINFERKTSDLFKKAFEKQVSNFVRTKNPAFAFRPE